MQTTKIKKLGQGAFGTVYHERWTEPASKVFKDYAVKVIILKGDDGDHKIAALKERDALSRLHHAHIVTLHSWTVEPTMIRLVLGLMDGNLLEHIRERGSYTLKTFVEWAKELLSALVYLHTEGYVHCDLKSNNILVKDGHLKLGDFGHVHKHQTKSWLPLTTLWYRAPEILLGQSTADIAIDVWSMGCVFMEMLEGITRLKGDSEIDQIFRVFKLRGTPSDDSYLATLPNFKRNWPQWKQQPLELKGMPPALNEWIGHMLELDPTQRWTAKQALENIPYR